MYGVTYGRVVVPTGGGVNRCCKPGIVSCPQCSLRACSVEYRDVVNICKSMLTCSLPCALNRLASHIQVRSSLARECRQREHPGITPEVLECVVQEAMLRELGESERADSVRGKAIRAR